MADFTAENKKSSLREMISWLKNNDPNWTKSAGNMVRPKVPKKKKATKEQVEAMKKYTKTAQNVSNKF